MSALLSQQNPRSGPSGHALPLRVTHWVWRFTRYVSQGGLIRYAPLAALILLAAYPILSGGLPSTGDGLNHFYRFAELDWHVRQGDLYPRWFTNMHYGFGAPVLNFYAPLSYYVPLLFRIQGLPLALSLQLSYALALLLAILGAYKWSEELAAAQPAALPHEGHQPLVTAAAYGLAPYLYFNIFHRGAYPETWALAIAPWILWSIHKAVRLPAARYPILAAAFIAALTLTHTLSALVFVPLALVDAAILLYLYRTPRHHVLRFTFCVFLSFLLTAFFTLPLLLESSSIQLARTYATGDLDYHRNFLSFSGLLAPPPNYDPYRVFNAMPPSLPWPQIALGLLALGCWLLARRQDPSPVRRPSSGVAGYWLLVVGLAALTLSFAEPLWSAVPVSRFIQFPWRLVGPASLFLAALAGEAVRYAPRAHPNRQPFWRCLLPTACCLLFFLFSLPWTYHAAFEAPHRVTPADTIQYEISSGQLGTASNAEYVPRWAAGLPDPLTLLPRFADGDLPVRLAPLPAQVTAHAWRSALNAEELTYTAPAPFTATFDLFYFPGWAATLDGQPIEIQPSSPHGLITVEAPSGRHTLRLSLQPTAPQRTGAVISALGLLVMAAAAFYRPKPRSGAVENQSPLAPQPAGLRFALSASAVLIVVLFSRILYFDRAETIFHHTELGSRPNPIAVNFDDQLELIGYEYAPQAVSGGRLPVTLYWRAVQPLAADYAVSVQLADRMGNRFGQSDSQHPNGVPTSRWRLEQYARDSHWLVSLEGTPPGDYRLLVTVYSERPLSILRQGAPIGVEYELGVVTLARAAPQAPGSLRLVDYSVAASSVPVGDPYSFAVLWNSGDDPPPELLARLAFMTRLGETVYARDFLPAVEAYPSDDWGPNELIRHPYSVVLPADLPPGEYEVWLSLMEIDSRLRAGPYRLGTLHITIPDRSFDIPPMQTRVDHDFAGAIRLLGYDLGGGSIKLYWQSLQPVSVGLTVFVHALDQAGSFVSGHDAPPSRPTPGWLPGEVIVDEHPFGPAGHFEVGLYNPITGERFGEAFVKRP